MNEQDGEWQEGEIPRSVSPYPDVNDPYPTAFPPWIVILWVLTALACLGGVSIPGLGLLFGVVGLDCGGIAFCGSLGLLVVTVVITLVAYDQIKQSRSQLR